MRSDNSPTGRKRKSNSTTKILGLTLLVLVLVLAGLVAAAMLINRIADPLVNDPSATGISVLVDPPSHTEGSPSTQSPGEELPPEKSGQTLRTYGFEYSCQSYSISLPVFDSIYEYFSSKDKLFYYQGSLPADWQEEYYLKFLESDYDLDAINSLVAAVAGGLNTSDDELVIALISLVQNLTYDCEKLFSYEYQQGEGFETNFPYETLYLQEGVCGDSSILLGKILRELGYGTAFLLYNQNNHMALGIQCPVEVATYIKNGIGYCYIETTGPFRIGVKPTNLAGNEFREETQIIPISDGKSFNRMVSLAEELERDVRKYGEFIRQLATCEEIALYKEISDRETGLDLQLTKIDQKKMELDAADLVYQQELQKYNEMGCEGTLPREKYDLCVAQENVLNQEAAIFNDVVEEYNQLLGEYRFNYDQYAISFDAFEAMMQRSRQGCAVVYTDSLDKQEEVESVNP
jgi:hypothetical protein